jgi:hypothetical protein
MDYKDCLTNEQLLKRFKNQFELVRYAIKIAEHDIKSGKNAYALFDTDNVAFNVLSEIAAGQDSFVEEVEEKEEEIEPVIEVAPKKSKSKAKALR